MAHSKSWRRNQSPKVRSIAIILEETAFQFLLEKLLDDSISYLTIAKKVIKNLVRPLMYVPRAEFFDLVGFEAT